MRTLTRLAALGAALAILLTLGVTIGASAADAPPATLRPLVAPQAPPSTVPVVTTQQATTSTTTTTTAPPTTVAPTTSSTTTTTHVHPAPAPPPPPAPAPTVAPAPPPQPAGALPAILITIRGCESGHDYTARNPRSSASGAFQFIDSTWRAYGDSRWPRAYLAPREVQDAAALRLYRASGTSPWNASRSCWG